MSPEWSYAGGMKCLATLCLCLLASTATGQNIDLFESGKQRFRSLRADDEALLEAVGKEVGDDPVVVFCANSKCNAARRLIRAWQRKNLCPNYFYMHEGYQPHRK